MGKRHPLRQAVSNKVLKAENQDWKLHPACSDGTVKGKNLAVSPCYWSVPRNTSAVSARPCGTTPVCRSAADPAHALTGLAPRSSRCKSHALASPLSPCLLLERVHDLPETAARLLRNREHVLTALTAPSQPCPPSPSVPIPNAEPRATPSHSSAAGGTESTVIEYLKTPPTAPRCRP